MNRYTFDLEEANKLIGELTEAIKNIKHQCHICKEYKAPVTIVLGRLICQDCRIKYDKHISRAMELANETL